MVEREYEKESYLCDQCQNKINGHATWCPKCGHVFGESGPSIEKGSGVYDSIYFATFIGGTLAIVIGLTVSMLADSTVWGTAAGAIVWYIAFLYWRLWSP